MLLVLSLPKQLDFKTRPRFVVLRSWLQRLPFGETPQKSATISLAEIVVLAGKRNGVAWRTIVFPFLEGYKKTVYDLPIRWASKVESLDPLRRENLN